MISLILFSMFLQCTYTKDANNNVILGAGCTANDIFVNAAGGDFHLKATSPAVGNALCLPDVPTDLDGIQRPNRGPNTRFPGDTGCEIGAYQFNAPNPAPLAPTNLRIVSVQ